MAMTATASPAFAVATNAFVRLAARLGLKNAQQAILLGVKPSGSCGAPAPLALEIPRIFAAMDDAASAGQKNAAYGNSPPGF